MLDDLLEGVGPDVAVKGFLHSLSIISISFSKKIPSLLVLTRSDQGLDEVVPHVLAFLFIEISLG